MLFACDTFDLFLYSQVVSAVVGEMHWRCLVMVGKYFWHTFTCVFVAPEATVSYLKWFGGQPDGKEHSRVTTKVPDPTLPEPFIECTWCSTLCTWFSIGILLA